MAAPGAVGIGEVAVLIEQRGQLAGGGAQLFGWQPAGQLSELGFGGVAGVVVDEAGQPFEELPDDLHVLGADRPAALRGGGVGEHRLQWLCGHRRPRPQIGGLLDAPVRLGGGDP